VSLRFTTLALGLDRQSHASIAADRSPCPLVHMQQSAMTRPHGEQPATARSHPSAVTTHRHRAAFLCSNLAMPARRKKHRQSTKACMSLCHPTPPSPTAHHTPRPGSATPARTGVAATGKLSLEIISGIKGAQPCHPTISSGRRLCFLLRNAHAASPDAESADSALPESGRLDG
jgi:hypothetical protein